MRFERVLRLVARRAGELGLVSFAACSSPTVAQPPPAPVDWNSLREQPPRDAGVDIVTEKERALARTYATALAQPSFAQLGSLVDDDARFTFPGLEDAHGRTSIVHAHELVFGAFDDRQVALTRVWRTPNEQTLEWVLTGKQERPWMGAPALHKPVAFKGLTLLWTKDDGSIGDIHTYFDVAAVKAQLGIGPKGLAPIPPSALPTGEPQVFESSGSPQEASEVSAARSLLDALEGNSEPGYLGAMTDDVESYSLERADAARGKEASKVYFRGLRRAIGQLDTTAENAWGIGPFAVVEYTIAGEQLGALGWIPAQRDTVLRFHLVDVIEFRDGRAARLWRFDNPSEALVP